MTEITDLPLQILSQIFAILPLNLEEAFQLTRVCKYFKTVITSSEYMHLHLERNPMNNPSSYLLINSWSHDCLLRICAMTFARRVEIRLPDDIKAKLGNDDVTVHGSYNGLLCISSSVVHVDTPIYLWNPSIRKIRQLPHGLINMENDCDCRVTLGFGFHSAGGNDYKVIKLVQHAEDTFQVEVYSLNSNSWKSISRVPSLPHGASIHPKCAYLKGVVHWAIYASNDTDLFTISFDLRNEQFKVRPFPDLYPLMYPNFLQVWNNSLCFFRHKFNKKKNYWQWHILTLGMEPYTIKPFGKFLMPGPLTIPWPLGLNTSGNGRNIDYAIDDEHSRLVSYAGHYIFEIALSIHEETWYVDVYKESLLLLN